MEERVTRARKLFYIGLFIVLAAAILPTALPSGGAGLAIGLTVAGALVAVVGRLWLSHLQRFVRRHSSDRSIWATR